MPFINISISSITLIPFSSEQHFILSHSFGIYCLWFYLYFQLLLSLIQGIYGNIFLIEEKDISFLKFKCPCSRNIYLYISLILTKLLTVILWPYSPLWKLYWHFKSAFIVLKMQLFNYIWINNFKSSVHLKFFINLFMYREK